MNALTNHLFTSRELVAALFFCATRLPAGHQHILYEHPAEFREANMIMLRFQTALTAQRWQETLFLCSDQHEVFPQEFPVPADAQATEVQPLGVRSSFLTLREAKIGAEHAPATEKPCVGTQKRLANSYGAQRIRQVIKNSSFMI